MSRYAGLIELVLVGGGVLLFAWWQLRALKRDRRITRERLAREELAREEAANRNE